MIKEMKLIENNEIEITMKDESVYVIEEKDIISLIMMYDLMGDFND